MCSSISEVLVCINYSPSVAFSFAYCFVIWFQEKNNIVVSF